MEQPMNDGEAIVSANGTPPRRTRTSSDSSANPGQSPTDRRRIHLVLQGKGGIGKSLAASYLVQYHRHIGKPVKAFDADPVNASLAAMPGLDAQRVALVVDDAIDVKAADQFIEMLLTYDEDVVIDSGAASFLPLSSYLIDTEIAGLLDAAGRELVLHTIVTGGGSFLDTARGLEAVVEDFPATTTLVVWTNEYFGPVRFEDVAFEDTPVYRSAKPRISAMVHLKRQNPQSFGANLATLLERKQTFDEALAGTTFNTVERQRLAMIQREVFEQLARVVS